MDRYITMEDANTVEITLKNSRDQELTLNLGEIIRETNREGYHIDYFPKELSFHGKEGDWMEVIKIPTYNGKYNEETGEDEFCFPQWCEWSPGHYDSNIVVDRWFWHEDSWHAPVSYMPPDIKKATNNNWEAFRVPVFSD